MAVKNNPVLGTVTCSGCGGMCSVHQTARGAGRYLYTRCGTCGPDQRTGPQVQTRLWRETEWRNGPPEVAPPNLLEPGRPGDYEVPGQVGEPSPEPEPEPADEPEPEPAADGDDEGEGGQWAGFAWLTVGAVGVLALLSGRG